METSFGEYIRKERETRELSLDDISKQTKIQKRLLIALEENRLDQLPSHTFVRGFIRLYAECVGLDPKQVLLRFEQYLKELHPELSSQKPAAEKGFKISNILIPAVIFVVVASIVAASVIGNRSQRAAADSQMAAPGPTPAVAPTQRPPAGQPAVEQVNPLTAPYTVKIKALEICWLLATIDEKTSREAMLQAGEVFEVKAEQHLSLLLGNAGGAEVTVNGVILKPIGGHWKPARLLIPEELDSYLPQDYELKKEIKAATDKIQAEASTVQETPEPKPEPAATVTTGATVNPPASAP
jgi:cytoskeleton protein RodZ